MKKTFLLLVVSMLLCSAFLVPAMATPAQKESFIAVQVPDQTPPPSPDIRTWVTDGDTFHTRNLLGSGHIWFDKTVPSGPPTGTTTSEITIDLNVKTGVGNIKFVMTWTIGAGTYEGNLIGTLVAPPYTEGPANYNMYVHGVLQGKGVFAGQTVLVNGTRLVGQPFEWTGTIVIP